METHRVRNLHMQNWIILPQNIQIKNKISVRIIYNDFKQILCNYDNFIDWYIQISDETQTF